MSDHSNSKEKWIKQKREARKQAFSLLFEQIFQKETMEDIIQDARDARDLEVDKFTKKLISGVETNIEEIDKLIEANLKGWRKNRISKVSLTIMRMAVYEMVYEEDIPVSVSINEAVELAKEFATPADGSFVNGVLGAILRELEAAE